MEFPDTEVSERMWIPTTEVMVGDLLAHKLSDTPWTYTEVTGWEDKFLQLSRFGGNLKDVTQRRFIVTGAPWWVEGADLWHSIGDTELDKALIKRR